MSDDFRGAETVEFLTHNTPSFNGPEMWPSDSHDLNHVNYSIRSVME